MSTDTRMIEVDRTTADALERSATERGLTVAQVVAELVPVAVDSEAITELERRWAAAQSGETVPHEEVERWLATWGTPEFRPWRGR